MPPRPRLAKSWYLPNAVVPLVASEPAPPAAPIICLNYPSGVGAGQGSYMVRNCRVPRELQRFSVSRAQAFALTRTKGEEAEPRGAVCLCRPRMKGLRRSLHLARLGLRGVGALDRELEVVEEHRR